MEPKTSQNVCKFLILEKHRRRVFHPKLHENLAERVAAIQRKTCSIKRCLFGKANPDDTRRMLDEQREIDRRRIFEKFGFDVRHVENVEKIRNDDGENNENDRNEQNRSAERDDGNAFGEVVQVKNFGRKVLKARRKVTFTKAQTSQSQQFITDFYQARKNSHQPLEKKQTSAPN